MNLTRVESMRSSGACFPEPIGLPRGAGRVSEGLPGLARLFGYR